MAFSTTFRQYIELIFCLIVLLVCLPYIEVFPDLTLSTFIFSSANHKGALTLPIYYSFGFGPGAEIIKRLVHGEIG